MTEKEKKKRFRYKHIEDIPVAMTDWIGSTQSLLVHTLFFIGIFILYFLGFALDTLMLFLTTIVSLEAIYLAIFIQMTVNRNTQSLEEVEEDIDEIQEDVEGMEKDIDEIQEDIDKLEEDEAEEESEEEKTQRVLNTIEGRLQTLIEDIETLKSKK
jgi:low affinity Fe/Cu permease